MLQMMVRSQRLPTADAIGRYVLEARAGDVPFLVGYRMSLSATGATFTDQNDTLQLKAVLLAAPRADSAGTNIGDPLGDSVLKNRATLGVEHASWNLQGPSTVGTVFMDFVKNGPWMPCGFEVPGIWLAGYNRPNGVTTVGLVTLHILFDWVRRSPIQVAALYTTYGMDPVDSTERQTAGEVDFNRAIGEGALPPLVG